MVAGDAGRTAPIDPATLVEELSAHLLGWLSRQRWFGADVSEIVSVRPAHFEVIRRSWPMLLWTPVDVTFADGTVDTYQLLLGADQYRPDHLDDRFVVGEVTVPSGTAWIFDALADPVLAAVFVDHIAPRIAAREVVMLSGEQSNTSLIVDRRWIVKVYRRLEEGPNPDIEITTALGEAGFERVPVPIEIWRNGAFDLAVVRAFHARAVDGMAAARASLDELLARRCQPRETAEDFAPRAHALGETTAMLHVALARSFGAASADPQALIDSLVVHLRRVAPPGLPTERIEATYRRLVGADDLGSAIRIHGDLHLGQSMLTRRHWLILDFEGEPTRSLVDRREPSSPLRDVAGMIRSFHYAAELALAGVEEGERDRELDVLAEAWEERCVDHFISGYASVDDVHRLLPRERVSRDALLMLFELDKAVYEVAYEAAHRPELIDIPARAVRRLLGPGVRERW